jgi:SAM-dependent methyltransferase
MEWFSNWFNSTYYHLLYKSRDFIEAENFINNIIEKYKFPKNYNFLDLACGKGRHSIFLNKKGYHVTGLDIAPESIAEAQKYSNETLQFAVHDMRNKMPSKYHVILNLFTSFGYFETENEDFLAIKNMADALENGGTLIIDFLNPKTVIENLVKEETKTIDGVTFHLKRFVENGFIKKDIQFEAEGKKYHFQEQVKAIFKSDFDKFLKKSNLTIIDVFGDYQLNTFDEKLSSRMILVAKKVL